MLGFNRVPPTVGRVFNMTTELWEKADEDLGKTFFYSPGTFIKKKEKEAHNFFDFNLILIGVLLFQLVTCVSPVIVRTTVTRHTPFAVDHSIAWRARSRSCCLRSQLSSGRCSIIHIDVRTRRERRRYGKSTSRIARSSCSRISLTRPSLFSISWTWPFLISLPVKSQFEPSPLPPSSLKMI